MIDATYATLRERGSTRGGSLSPGTLARVHVVLRSALAQAQRWGWVWDNPAQHAHRIVVAHAELHPPTPAELDTLLAHVASVDPMFHAFVLLAATSGARRAQLLGLRWDNVRRDTMRVAFCAGWVEGPNGPTLAPTKTKRRHSVDLDAMTFADVDCARRRRRRGVRVQRRRGSDRLETQPRHQGLRPSPSCGRATRVPSPRSTALHGHRDAPRRHPTPGRGPPTRPPAPFDDAQLLRPSRPRRRWPSRDDPPGHHRRRRVTSLTESNIVRQRAAPISDCAHNREREERQFEDASAGCRVHVRGHAVSDLPSAVRRPPPAHRCEGFDGDGPAIWDGSDGRAGALMVPSELPPGHSRRLVLTRVPCESPTLCLHPRAGGTTGCGRPREPDAGHLRSRVRGRAR